MSAVGSSDGVGRAVCALTGAWRAEAAEPPTQSGEQRSGDTASPMVLRCIVGEEVAATFGDTEDLFSEGSLVFVSSVPPPPVNLPRLKRAPYKKGGGRFLFIYNYYRLLVVFWVFTFGDRS